MPTNKVVFPISTYRLFMISQNLDSSEYVHIKFSVCTEVLNMLMYRSNVYSHTRRVEANRTHARLIRVAALAHPLLYKHQLTIPELQVMTVLHNNFHKAACMQSVLLKIRLGIEP